MKMARKVLPIGFWRRGNMVDVGWLERAKQAQKHPHLPFRPKPRCTTLSLYPTETLVERVMAEMTELPNLNKVEFLLVSAVSVNSVWEKSIIVAEQNLSEEECRRRCYDLLEKELPVSMEQVWFDFHSSPLKQGTLLEMSAVLIERANECRTAFMPMPLQVLDSVSHALMRAFQYFEEDLPKETIFLYIDDDYSVLMQEKNYQFHVLQLSETDPETALAQFCERYNTTPTQVCLYSKNTNEAIDELVAKNNWVQCKTHSPFIAFGLALWSLDFGY